MTTCSRSLSLLHFVLFCGVMNGATLLLENTDVYSLGLQAAGTLIEQTKGSAAFGTVCCSFPCTMVDRITPVTANEHITLLEEDYGIGDKWPVVAEDFKQWVIGVRKQILT